MDNKTKNPVLMKYKHTRTINSKATTRKEKNKNNKDARAEQIKKRRNIQDCCDEKLELGLPEKTSNLPEKTKSSAIEENNSKTKSEKRKQELLIWKKNRDKERKIEKQKYKTNQFVVKHVNHSPPKYLRPRPTTRSMSKILNSVAKEKGTKNKDVAEINSCSKSNTKKKKEELENVMINHHTKTKMILIINLQLVMLPVSKEPEINENEIKDKVEKSMHLQKALNRLDIDNNGFTPRRIKSTSHFKKLVENERQKLTSLNEKWNLELAQENLTEEVKGKIRTVIGQAQLLMDQRFKQFLGLIDIHQSKTAEKDATSTDLQGFWDMISFQIDDVNEKFSHLETEKNNQWEEKETKKNVEIKKKQIEVKPKASSKGALLSKKEDMRLKTRQFKLAMKAKMQAAKLDSDNADDIKILPGTNGHIEYQNENNANEINKRTPCILDATISELELQPSLI